MGDSEPGGAPPPAASKPSSPEGLLDQRKKSEKAGKTAKSAEIVELEEARPSSPKSAKKKKPKEQMPAPRAQSVVVQVVAMGAVPTGTAV